MKLLLRKYHFVSKKQFVLGALILLCLTTIKSQTNLPPENPRALNLRWLIAGSFEAQGENALFVDYLGGEAQTRPVPGAAAGDASQGIQWREEKPNEKGEFDFGKIWNNRKRSVAYAYAEIPAEEEKYLVATVGSGINVQLRLNGEVIHESRLSRKPEADKDTVVLRLRKGSNHLLVKTEGAGDWKLQLTVREPAGKIFVNQTATIVPDFRSDNRNDGAWGQIEMANAGGSLLNGVTVEMLGDDLVFSSASEQVNFAAGEVKRIPFWVAGKALAAGQAVKPLQLRVSAGGGESFSFTFAPRVRKPAEYFVTTYRSFVDGSVQPFSVLLPTAFKRDEIYPLSLLLHGAHVTDWGQNIVAYDAKEWAIQVAVHDRGNNRYRDIGEVDIDEVLTEVKRRYRIDEDRIYLSGHSMGGYGTWFQATHRPDMWASISPQAGYSDYFLYNPAMSGALVTTQHQFQKRLLEMWSPLLLAENLLHVPAYVVHGAKDDNVVVEHSRKMAARLKELGYQYVYDENPEGGHWWGPRGKYYGTEVVDKPPIWTFFQKHDRRASAPSRVIFNTDSLHYRKAYWVTIDELDEANQVARVEAEIKPENTIQVKQNNITQFTLELAKAPIETHQPIAVGVNNQTVFKGVLPASKNLTLRREPDGSYLQILNETDLRIGDKNAVNRLGGIAVRIDRSGNPVQIVSLPPEPLKKTEKIYGTIADAFNRPFLFVVGTGAKNVKDQSMVAATRRAAESLAREWMARANGSVTIKADSEITRDDIAEYNLILFGNAQINSLIAQINDRLPIKFAPKGLIAGDKAFTTGDAGMAMVYPNPLNPSRYVVVVGGTSVGSMEIASRLRLHELPDYAVFDNRTLSGEKLQFADGGFFDKFWHLPK